MKSKKDLWFSQLAKGIFSELRCYGYKKYCIVGFSLCKEYARLCFGSILKLLKAYKSKFYYVD